MVKKRVSRSVVSDVAAFIAQANPSRERPVKLQVNNSGAWKDVVRFDASDGAACDQVFEAAETLGRIGDVTWRICIADSLNTRLMHWTPADGWKAAK